MSKRRFIYAGGRSTRFHTEDMLIRQDIASHSFGVAWMCELLTSNKARKVLIMSALSHDLAEHRVGDIPSPSKRRLNLSEQFEEYEMEELSNVGLSYYHDELTDGEKIVLKMADILDGMSHCVRERRLGNKNVEIIYQRFLHYAVQLIEEKSEVESATSFCFEQQIAENIIEDINNEWMETLNDKCKR